MTLFNGFTFSADVNSQLESFSDELAQKTEESSRQKEEITNLLSQVVELQRKNREASITQPPIFFFPFLTSLHKSLKETALI